MGQDGRPHPLREDNYTGGLAGALAEAAAAATGGATQVASMTCRRIPKSAKTPEATLKLAGLSVEDIAERVRGMIKN